MNGLLQDPFVLLLLGALIGLVGGFGGKVLDRWLAQADETTRDARQTEGRLRTIEAFMSHALDDQREHKEQGKQLQTLEVRMAAVETMLREHRSRSEQWMRAIYARLPAAENA